MVLAGGLVFLMANLESYTFLLGLEDGEKYAAGLEAMLELFGIALVIVGGMTIKAASRFHKSQAKNSDLLPLDWYLPKSRR